MSAPRYHALFLCTGNSARSIMAESILRRLGSGRFGALSAGSHPTGRVQPLALEVLREHGYPTEGLSSKSWDVFAGPGGPELDFVITVCDQAAGEPCPHWPGQPMTAHWGVADPAAVEGPETVRRAAFRRAFVVLERRIELFTHLRLEALDRLSLRARLDEIGKSQPPDDDRGEPR
jgi:arsenate reductase